MPRTPGFVEALRAKLYDVTVVLLLPLFFAFSGLRTHIGLIDGVMWLYFAVIMVAAIAGKLGGAAMAARATGLPWREATALGVLVNTRGLIELVVLNIGLDVGIISPALFAILVLMAIVTTFMTTPLLDRIYPAHLRRPLTA
jgi:Kef-type K+ transport system membrane component KefB